MTHIQIVTLYIHPVTHIRDPTCVSWHTYPLICVTTRASWHAYKSRHPLPYIMHLLLPTALQPRGKKKKKEKSTET